MTEPCDLSAVEARRRILGRSLSAVELLQNCVARIKKTNQVVNAIVAKNVESARKRVKAIEQALRRGDEVGLLAGLPIGVKDLQATRGAQDHKWVTPIPGALNNVILIDDEQIRGIWTGWYAARSKRR